MCLIIFRPFSLLSVFRWYLFVRYLTAAILCSVGWQESKGMIVSVAVCFLYISNFSLSYSFLTVISRKFIIFSLSFSIVNFIVGIILLNELSTSSIFVRVLS
jgi:uncharacterized membrane protein